MVEKISRKINILEMHSSLGYAGGQRNMFTFVKYLDKSIFNVFVASYVEGGIHEERLKEIGVEFIVSKRDVVKILEFIKEKRIDVIHIHRSGGYVPTETQIFEGAKKINEKLIIVEKNVFGKYDNISGENIDCSFFQSMMHLNERYLVDSKKAFDFSRLKVLYNMVDVVGFERYRLNQGEINDFKKTLGINEADFVVGKIGRAHVAKWSDLVLDMMPNLVKLVPNIKFIIIGVPPSRIKLIQKSDFKNKIIILPETGEESAVHKFYQIIDVLAHSSKIGECNGNTINEAMFWKKPVVLNSTPAKDNGQLEQVKHMESGIVANHPQTFARALSFLYHEPNKRIAMGNVGHDLVLKTNSVSNIISQLEKMLIEKFLKEGLLESLYLKDRYSVVDFSPNSGTIINYRQEYKKRLTWDFGNLSLLELFINFLNKPRKLYWKVKDFLEHNYGVII